MKRVLHYNTTTDGYGCFENGSLIFEIKKTDLQFNVKDFYEAFYGEGKDYSQIILENDVTNDSEGKRIYACIDNLVKQISEKMATISDVEDEEKRGE